MLSIPTEKRERAGDGENMKTSKLTALYGEKIKRDMNSNIRYSCGHGAENIKDKKKIRYVKYFCSICAG